MFSSLNRLLSAALVTCLSLPAFAQSSPSAVDQAAARARFAQARTTAQLHSKWTVTKLEARGRVYLVGLRASSGANAVSVELPATHDLVDAAKLKVGDGLVVESRVLSRQSSEAEPPVILLLKGDATIAVLGTGQQGRAGVK